MFSLKEVAEKVADSRGDEVEAVCIVGIMKGVVSMFSAFAGVSNVMIDDNAVRIADALIKLLDEDLCAAKKIAIAARADGKLRMSRTQREEVNLARGSDEQQIGSFEIKVSDEMRALLK